MAGARSVTITTNVPMSGQHAQPVYVDDSLPMIGGPAQAIVVTTGEVPQMGGPPMAVRLAPAGVPVVGPAWPVYVVSGSLGSSTVVYLYQLLDKFTTNRAAGAVNGTAAEPGGTSAPNRTVVDGSSLLTIASSQMTLASGGVANNPNLVYTASYARAAGRTLATKCGTGNSSSFVTGWSSGAAGTTNTHRHNWNNGFLRTIVGFANIATLLHNSPYWLFTVLRTSGAMFFGLGADLAYPTLLHIDRLVSSTPLFPSWSMSSVNGGNMIVDDMAIPDDLLYPSAIASDDYTRANGAPGSTNSYDGGTSKSYTDRLGTSAITTNVLGFSALSAGEGLATIDSGMLDHVSIVSCTRAAGIVGIVGRWQNASNYIRVQHDGTNLQIVKVVAGTPTTVATQAVAFSAGADLEAIFERTTVRALYNNTQLAASPSTISDAALQTGTHIGLYSTDTGNTFDTFSVWPRGTNNEYVAYRNECVLTQAQKMIVFDGDSLTFGSTVTAAQSYPYQLIDLIGRPSYDYYNVGVTGNVCADLLADRLYSYGPLVSARIWPTAIVDLWVGSNDIANARTAVATYADITTLVQYYQSLGAKVAVSTILVRVSIAGAAETERLALNVLINANSAGANAVCDLAANANLQNFNDVTYFNADKTHLTATGYGVVATIQQPIVSAL